jgi:hypothetical protein
MRALNGGGRTARLLLAFALLGEATAWLVGPPRYSSITGASGFVRSMRMQQIDEEEDGEDAMVRPSPCCQETHLYVCTASSQ